MRALEVRGIPRTVIVDKEGIIRADLLGARDMQDLLEELKKIGIE